MHLNFFKLTCKIDVQNSRCEEGARGLCFRFFFSHCVSNDARLPQLSELCCLSMSVPRINYSAPLIEPNPTRDDSATRKGNRKRGTEKEEGKGETRTLPGAGEHPRAIGCANDNMLNSERREKKYID